MKKINQLKIGALLSYISLGLSSFISILYTPIMLRLLGQSEYGLFNLSNSVIGYLGVLDFGLGNAVIRYTAKYRALNDKKSEENLYGMFIIIYSIIAFIIIILGYYIILNLDIIFSKTLTITELNKMKILMIIMVFNLAISFPFGVFGGIIIAYEHFIFPKIISIIKAITNPLIIILLLFNGYKSISMIIATTLINILCIIVNLYYCFNVLKISVKFKKLEFNIIKEISIYSFFIFINMIVDKIYWSTDQFILGAVSGTVAVAIYTVGSTITTYYMTFSTAISGVFLPKVTKMVTKNANNKELSNLFLKTGRIQYIVMSFILGGFFLVGKEFIQVWAGREYKEAFYIALIIMIPFTVPLIQNLGISILQAKNMHKFRAIVYILIATLNIIVSIPLAKILGGVGAALSTAISMVIGNVIIINIYYYKKIKLDIPYFWKNILIMSIPVLISIFLSKLVICLIDISGYLGIAIKSGIFTLFFCILMWNIGMNNYEKNLFRKPIIKLFKKLNKLIL